MAKNTSPVMESVVQQNFGLLAVFLALLVAASLCRAEADVPEDTRRWSNGVGLWGKRSAGSAADFEGIMHRGARLVNKRPEDSWHKLNALWGKRAAPSSSNWQTATGLWGKRSAPPMAPVWTVVADYDFWPGRN